MGTFILISTIVTIAGIQVPFLPHQNTPTPISHVNAQVLAAETVASPTPTATPSPTPTHKEYVTQDGDTIREIARREYGSELQWTTIWNDNEELTDPTLIHPGLTLTLRTKAPAEPEEIVRPLPTETPTPTPIPSETPAPSSAGVQVGSAVGTFAAAYMEAGSKYGIPWQILYAMHKVESGLRDGPIDSGAGPQGPLQFLPATWASYGVDGNGDGNADINSAVDGIYSAANYLSKHASLEAGLNSYGKVKDDVFRIAQENGWTQ